jgi:hypothetical protein
MATNFAFEFDALSAKNGWMNCWLVMDGQRQHMDASSAFAPFGDALKFARALASDRLPYEFIWQEEGPWLEFKAFPIALDRAKFRLVIERSNSLFLDTVLDRMDLALGLLDALRGVALDCPGAESEWEFPYFLIEDFEKDLARGFPAEAALPVSSVHFIFYQCGGYGGVQDPAFSIWIDGCEPQLIKMDDNPRLWMLWVNMLERILHAEFPFEYDFNRDEKHDPDSEDVEEPSVMWAWEGWNYFRGDACTVPEQFQLKMDYEMKLIGMREEVGIFTFDRVAFVRAFVCAFQEFLKTDYLGFLENGQIHIDLRTLPLDRLNVD